MYCCSLRKVLVGKRRSCTSSSSGRACRAALGMMVEIPGTRPTSDPSSPHEMTDLSGVSGDRQYRPASACCSGLSRANSGSGSHGHGLDGGIDGLCLDPSAAAAAATAMTRAGCASWGIRGSGRGIRSCRGIGRARTTRNARDVDEETVGKLLGDGCHVEVLALGEDTLHLADGLTSWAFDLSEGFVAGIDDLHVHDRRV